MIQEDERLRDPGLRHAHGRSLHVHDFPEARGDEQNGDEGGGHPAPSGGRLTAPTPRNLPEAGDNLATHDGIEQARSSRHAGVVAACGSPLADPGTGSPQATSPEIGSSSAPL